MLHFRKATENDINGIEQIYSEIHDYEEQGLLTTGWKRGIYPTRENAEAAVKRQDMYIAELDHQLIAAAVINQEQLDSYKDVNWKSDAPDDEVMVLHTLVLSPKFFGQGLGTAFVLFFEQLAFTENCRYLRLDTNARNEKARALYKRFGYTEAGIVPCTFQGLENIQLVLLEKELNMHCAGM